MKLYLAGPMTRIPQFNFPAFERGARRLRDVGYEVLSPHEEDNDEVQLIAWLSEAGDPSELPDTFTMPEIIRRNVEDVMKCDGMALLQGWTNSSGATMEQAVIVRLDRPSDSVQGWLDNSHLATEL